MKWFMYALFCAFFLFTSDVFAKKALKNTRLLFSIVYVGIICKEKSFYERPAGGRLILTGILFITLL